MDKNLKFLIKDPIIRDWVKNFIIEKMDWQSSTDIFNTTEPVLQSSNKQKALEKIYNSGPCDIEKLVRLVLADLK